MWFEHSDIHSYQSTISWKKGYWLRALVASMAVDQSAEAWLSWAGLVGPMIERGPFYLPILSSLWETAFPLLSLCPTDNPSHPPLVLSISLSHPSLPHESDSSCRLPSHPFLHSSKGEKRKGWWWWWEWVKGEERKEGQEELGHIISVCLHKYVFVCACGFVCFICGSTKHREWREHFRQQVASEKGSRERKWKRERDGNIYTWKKD